MGEDPQPDDAGTRNSERKRLKRLVRIHERRLVRRAGVVYIYRSVGWKAGVDALAHRCHLPSKMQDAICTWYEQDIVKRFEEEERDASQET